MLDPYHDVFFCPGSRPGMKYSLILLLLFFVLMLIFQWEVSRSRPKCGPKAFWRSLSVGGRRSVVVTAATYGILLLTGLLPKGPLYGLGFLRGSAELFLSVEPLLSICVTLLAAGSRLIRGSRREYLNTVNAAARLLIFLSVASSLLTLQIPLSWYNILWFVVVGTILTVLKTFSLELPPEPVAKGSLYAPVTAYESLFLPRQRQADELCQLISGSESGGISICVAGSWGSGKSSLVMGVYDRLRHGEHAKGYEFIFIRALELDSLESLFRYLFARIKEILRARGAYVGPGSEYQRLISSAGGVIANEQISSIVERRLFPAEKDYRRQRQRLEALMAAVLGDDRVVIVVDDIERCAPEKAREFLYFVKEIATMRCCVSVFVTDDTRLPRPEASAENGPDFFDKFFNYRIVLAPVSLADMMDYFETEWHPTNALNTYNLDSPRKVCQSLQQRLRDRAESIRIIPTGQNQQENEREAEQRRAYLRSCAERLGQSLSRPRTLHKFYDTYCRICGRLQKYYDGQSQEKLAEYFDSLQLSELLFFLAFLEVGFPAEWEKIQTEGIRRYLDRVQASQDEPQRFLSKLLQDTLFQDYLAFASYTYQDMKRVRFLDTLLTAPEELPKIVNGFTTQEQEWFDAIEREDGQAMEAHWPSMLQAVVEQYHRIRNGSMYLEHLFRFAKEQVETGSWDVDVPFQIFEHSTLDEDLLINSRCLVPLVSLFCDAFSENCGISKRAFERLQTAGAVYSRNYCMIISSVLQYGAPGEGKTIVDALDRMTINQMDHRGNLNQFMAQIQKLGVWRTRLTGHLTDLEGLDTLIQDAEAFLREQDLLNYPDVQHLVERMFQARQELGALFQLLDRVQRDRFSLTPGLRVSTLSPEILPDTIRFFKQEFSSPDFTQNKHLMQDFKALFQYISTLEPGTLSQEMLSELHDLVTQYYQANSLGYQGDVRSFRGILLEQACPETHPPASL